MNVALLNQVGFQHVFNGVFFFANGGGKCYVCSVGGYADAIEPADFSRGLDRVAEEDEPTLLVAPELVRLDPADYLTIARHYPTVLIDGVPKMGKDERTWAARFVTLIDALYECRTKLVMSAVAQPDDLYAAGDGAFEFQRTASRRLAVTTMAFARPASRCATFCRKCSTTICTRAAMLCGCSRTQPMMPFFASLASTSFSVNS